jgi:hypothetical protein
MAFDPRRPAAGTNQGGQELSYGKQGFLGGAALLPRRPLPFSLARRVTVP